MSTKPFKKKVSVSLPLRPPVNCGSYFKKIVSTPTQESQVVFLLNLIITLQTCPGMSHLKRNLSLRQLDYNPHRLR